MIECNMCWDLVHDLIHGVCYTCSEEVAMLQEDIDIQSNLFTR